MQAVHQLWPIVTGSSLKKADIADLSQRLRAEAGMHGIGAVTAMFCDILRAQDQLPVLTNWCVACG